VLAFYIRFAGLTRGENDFAPSELVVQGVDSSFYSFHPEEKTLARPALELSNPLAPTANRLWHAAALYLAGSAGTGRSLCQRGLARLRSRQATDLSCHPPASHRHLAGNLRRLQSLLACDFLVCRVAGRTSCPILS